MGAEGAGSASGWTGPLPDDAGRWLSAVSLRRARRSYTGEVPAAADLDALATLARRWHPWPDARVVLLAEAPSAVFMGIIGAYGGISRAPSALVFIGGSTVRGETVGYTGEALVLEATARGLDTCWVAGLFGAHATGALAALAPGERVYAVAALGHAVGAPSIKERLLFGADRPKMRRSLEEIAPGYGEWPVWAQAAVSAARIAPSAMNRQPWRFSLGDDALLVHLAGHDTPRISKRLDCGIAMLHAELGARGEGVVGRWELLAGPGVARFTRVSG